MIFSRVIPLFLSALSPLTAANFPMVPASDRLLTVSEVKTFWVNRLRTQPLPPKSTRLYPEREIARRSELARRQRLTDQIRSGHHDLAARLVCLSHNTEAWSRQGNDAKADECEVRLIRLREHVAKLATLEAQREAAVKVGEAADRITEMSGEIQRLRALMDQRVEGCG